MKQRNKYILIILLILIISALHYFTGSSDSPAHSFYKLLYYIPIILAAFSFGFKGGVIVSLAVSLIYSPFMLLSVSTFGWQAVNELLDIILFFTVGVITGILEEKKNISLLKLDNELKRYVLLENYMNSIIESIRSGVIAVNNDMLITMINQGAKAILNIEGDCIGQNLTEVFACCEEVKYRISECVEKGKMTENIEVTVIGGDKESTIKISVFSLSLENIKKGLVIIVDDITEMKRLQQQLQRNDKLAALGELSAGIAHEIRNPLGIIKAIEQTMKSELKGNSEAVKELDMIDEEIERANRVVKSLMEFGKPSRNEKAYYSVNDILEDVLAIIKKYLSQHGTDTEFDKSVIPEISADKEQLKQVFINIIFNAVQAMPDGGKLIISTEDFQGKFVKIAFRDTGIGIEENIIEKIFNPFYTTKDSGTGLGLSIAQRIIEEHGGRIYVSSSVGKGTTFEILLPSQGEELA